MQAVAAPALLRIAWKRIIIDEAHQIKNHKSLTAMSVCRLRATYRWALTGTPIHNDLLDMYALLRSARLMLCLSSTFIDSSIAMICTHAVASAMGRSNEVRQALVFSRVQAIAAAPALLCIA